MNGLSNLPPGCSESDIPGNRPEDEEVEVDLIISVGEIRDIKWFLEGEAPFKMMERHPLYETLLNIIQQIDEDWEP